MEPLLEQGSTAALVWAIASRPAPRETTCGDQARICASGERTVIAVVDGLGHGPPARQASEAALEVLCEGAGTPTARLEACHGALAKTRGAAVGVAVLDERDGAFAWTAAGNIEGLVLHPGGEGRARARLFVQSGLVGHRLKAPRETSVRLLPGGLLIVATDGLDESFAEGVRWPQEPGEAAAELLERYGRAHDDALVLVARFRGAA